MTWLLLALVSPFVYALANFTDKYLIEHYAKGGEESSVGSLALFSSLFGLIVIPIFLLFGTPSGAVPMAGVWTLILTGCIYLVAIILYLHALSDDDVSNVIPFWLTAPIFNFILGWLFLEEYLSSSEVFSCILILIGAALLTIEQNEDGKIHVKWNLALIMLGSSFLLAVNDLLFKKVAIETSFWDSLFWTYVGYALLGILLFLVVRQYREGFVRLLKRSGTFILGINVSGEGLMIGGDFVLRFATLLAPIALVQSVSDGFQPVFTFVGGVLLTLFFPHIIKESIDRRHLIRKTMATIIMVVGLFLLTLFG